MNAPERTIIPLLADYPSVVHGLDAEVYHSIGAVSNSQLKDFARSPLHYYALHVDPNRPPQEEDTGKLVGTLAHCATLEPAEFEARYVALPSDAPRRPTEAQWKAKNPSPDSAAAMGWWTDWIANNQGRQVITHEQRQVALAQARSVMANAQVAELLARGHAEVSAFWVDPVTGLRCRCRPDWVHDVNESSVILLDLKTYGDARPDVFKLQIARMDYERQAAFYSDGYERASGKKVLAFVFCAVETEWPYAASAVMLGDASMDKARKDVAALLERFAHCQQTNTWPGYGSSISLVELPAYKLNSNLSTMEP